MENWFNPSNNKGSNFLTNRKKRRFRFRILVLAVLLIAIAGLFFKIAFTFSRMDVGNNASASRDPDRINILLLGYGGPGHDGPYLTDSMMLLSIQKSTGRMALISIPRDIYVVMPGKNYKDKINAAYSLGVEEQGAAKGLAMAKEAVTNVTGLNIDHAVSVDHAAFKEIVDILGGIDIHLDKPFIEDQQWYGGGDTGPSWAFSLKTDPFTNAQKWVFEIPAGTSHLDGSTALYYIRARYSTDDFDRERRQQEIMLLIRKKALTLGVLGNPVKLFKLMDSLGENIRTDISAGDLSYLLSLYSKLDTKNIIRKVFDTTPGGLLYQSKTDKGEYVLLPVGDNFDKIREACKNVF